jgi:hypothetical protein
VKKALVTVCLLVVSWCCATVPRNGTPRLDPVQQVSTLDGRTICTAWSPKPKLWVTALHCGQAVGFQMRIGGVSASVHATDEPNDLMALDADLVTDTLPVSRYAPQIGDEIKIIGFPRAWVPTGQHMTFYGHVSNTRITLFETFTGPSVVQTFHGGGGPGTSGGPILGKFDSVVGMVRGGLETPSVVVVSTPYEEIRDFLKKLL